MNTGLALALLFGCVGVSLSQKSCSLDSPAKWQKCVNAFSTGKDDMSGNFQIRCHAAKAFLWCIKELEGCSLQNNYNSTRSEAHGILTSYPCKEIMSSGSILHLYLPLMLFNALAFCLA